jgi:vesicle-fusing ATPase
MAMASDFPFIKLISPESMIGFSESAKIAQLNKVFNDSYKSPLSVIVVDSIERILGKLRHHVVTIAPLTGVSLQRLDPYRPKILQRRPASVDGAARKATAKGVFGRSRLALKLTRILQGRRLLILATTSNRAMLDDMEMSESFDADIRVPAINDLQSVERIIRDVELFDDEQGLQHAMSLLRQAGFGEEGKLNIGVKKLLSMTEMARQDPDPAEKLVGSLIAQS